MWGPGKELGTRGLQHHPRDEMTETETHKVTSPQPEHDLGEKELGHWKETVLAVCPPDTEHTLSGTELVSRGCGPWAQTWLPAGVVRTGVVHQDS